MTATDVLGNDGVKPSISWKGKTYTVSFCCPQVVPLMEQEVRAHLLSSLRQCMEDAKNEPVLAEVLAPTIEELQRALKFKEWGFHRPYFTEVASQPGFAALSLFASIKHNHPEFTLNDAKEMVADCGQAAADVMEVTSPSFIRAMAMEMNISPEQLTEAYSKAKVEMEAKRTTKTT